MARYIFYALLLFGIIARHETWLIAGALATAMTYSGTAAIHAFILAVTTPNQLVLDIDIVGCWAVLTAGLFALWPVLQFSTTFRTSPFRPIFAMWAILIAFGAINAMILVYLDYPSEKVCKSSSGNIMTQPYQLGYPEFNCTYKCFNTHRILRAPSEIYVMNSDHLWGPGGDKNLLSALAGFAANVGVIVTIMFIPWPKSWRIVRMIHRKTKDYYELYGGKAPSPQRIAHMSAEELAALEKKRKTERRKSYLFLINQILSVISVIFNEVYLLRTGLPVEEQPYGVSQWGAAAAVALAILASLLNRWNERCRAKEAASNHNPSREHSIDLAEPSPYGKSFHEGVPYGRSFYELQSGRSFYSKTDSIIQQPKSRWAQFWGRLKFWSHSNTTDLEVGTPRPMLKRHPTW